MNENEKIMIEQLYAELNDIRKTPASPEKVKEIVDRILLDLTLPPLKKENPIVNILKQKIQELSQEYFNDVITVRRHIHQNPELSFEEFKTSQYIKSILQQENIPFKDGFVKTGIVATIEGKNPKKRIIALRADMDALPIEEQNNLPFKSINTGVMHACGHDIHTSSLIGTAKILNKLKTEFEGTILLIFQPGEEKLPGGAKLMLDEGALNNPIPEIVIGQHVFPELEAGKIGFKPGMYMASADELYVTIKGKGGHAAMPHQITDTILIASHIIVALQQIVSRHANAAIPSVLSFGKIIGLGATNVIPEEVKLEGTFRTMNEEWRENAHKQMVEIAKSIAVGMGGKCEFKIKKGYPFLVNDEKVTLNAKQYAIEYLGEDNVIDLDLRMTAEDFAYFSQQFPSTFYRLGIKTKGEEKAQPLHSPKFVVDEESLKTGIGTMAWLAINFLNNYE